MNSAVAKAFAKSRSERELWEYGRAWQSFDALTDLDQLTDHELRAIASEKCDILYFRGLMKDAETLLSDALAESSRSLQKNEGDDYSQSMHDLLRTKHALIRMDTNGEFDNALQVRTEMINLWAYREDSQNSPSELEVVIVSKE